jgi:K(+)-stimulated pyrophosphate-energized sodium pump
MFRWFVAYIFGTLFSAVAGKIGLEVATIAIGRSAEAAKKGIAPSFMAGFRGGAVMGMAVVGASLLGVTLVYLITKDATTILGFSFGASSLALFAKSGRRYLHQDGRHQRGPRGQSGTRHPEDDPRNPAVIADNVGDNVGDVAGMGADLFDSTWLPWQRRSSWAARSAETTRHGVRVCGAGLLASIIGVMTARIGKHGNPTKALNSSTYVTTGIYAVLTAVATYLLKLLLENLGCLHRRSRGWRDHRPHHGLLHG